MLTPKKCESNSIVRRQYLQVIFLFSVIIIYNLLNGCTQINVASEVGTACVKLLVIVVVVPPPWYKGTAKDS